MRIVNYAMGHKKLMLERGERHKIIKLCPKCKQGQIQINLAGKKNHIHMACSTPNCMMLME